MKQAIINLINALAEKYRPCKHDWELLDKSTLQLRLNPSMEWFKWSYRCKNCGEFKTYENN